MLYMKGTPMFPQCGFSARVVQILTHMGVPFQSANVLEDPELREGIKQFSQWPTIPQLYVKGEFVGGCDIVTEMFQIRRTGDAAEGTGRPCQGLTLRPGEAAPLIAITPWCRRSGTGLRHEPIILEFDAKRLAGRPSYR